MNQRERDEFIKMMRSMSVGKWFAAARTGVPLVFLAAAVLVVVLFFVKYVRPNEFAIKEVKIGVKPGIREQVYDTGLHLVAPFNILHRFPKDMQVFELTDNPDSMSREARYEKSAYIQTSDGFFVNVDVSVLYRIVDPYKLITTIGPGRLYEDNGIVPKVEPKLKETLGEMTTEEFYQSPLRVAKTTRAQQLLNEELADKGIQVEYVLVRYFKYSDEIQRNIEERKLKDQLVFTNQSKARASGEEALLKKAREEGEAKIHIKREEGRAYVVQRNAERDLYVRSKRAEADLLIKLAEARRTELVNNAYQRQGSDKLIGLKMADVMKGMNLIVLPSGGTQGFNPLHLEKNLQLFGVTAGGEGR